MKLHSSYSNVRPYLLAALIFVAAALCYGQYGFRGKLGRDQANHLYAAQRMVDGIPPYVSIFNHKTPLSTMMAGGAAISAGYFRWDDILAVRILFFFISCATVVAVFWLGRYCFDSERIGLLTAGTFLSFLPFATSAMRGSQPKTPTVLFGVLALLLTVRRNWFWAGVMAGCSFLTWQPTLIYFGVALLIASWNFKARTETLRSVSWLGLGFTLPLLLVGGYFYHYGALYDAIDGSILFNLFQLDRGSHSPLSPLHALGRTILRDYRLTAIPILTGFAVIGYLTGKQAWQYFCRNKHASKGFGPASPSTRRFAPILLSMPCFLGFSALDFQGPPDLFVLLPYAAIGFAVLVDSIVKRVETKSAKTASEPYLRRLGIVFLVAAAIASGINVRKHRERGLDEQRNSLSQIIRHYGDHAKYMSIGSPEFMVVSHRVNPNRYLFIINGIVRHIEVHTPGGVQGWLKQVEEFQPDVIAFGDTGGSGAGEILNWLKKGYKKETVGSWTIYVKG